jgi:prepilin-type N-terminal cleavage/methylation domain-containing protein
VQTRISTWRLRRGFSLLELLIVVSIILVISAVAFPSITRSVRTYRLGSMAASVSGTLQLARFDSVRLNKTNPPLSWRMLIVGNQTRVWSDRNGNGVADATEPQESFSREIQFMPAGTGLSIATMGYGNTQQTPAAVAFDARGSVNFGAGAPVVYVFVFGYPNSPNDGYTAVSVLPSGKTQIWRASANGPWQKR